MRCDNPAARRRPSNSCQKILRLVNNDTVAARLDGDDLLDLGRGHRVGRGEDLIELLERAPVGLDGEEEPEDGLDDVPADEHVDVVVLDVAQGDGRAEQVDERDDVDHRLVRAHALGARLRVEALHGVERLERGM